MGTTSWPDLLGRTTTSGDFELQRFQGFARTHSLETRSGRNPMLAARFGLLMHGEIEYLLRHHMFAAYQAGIEAVAPYVEVQDANGKWSRVLDDIGFPAGRSSYYDRRSDGQHCRREHGASVSPPTCRFTGTTFW